MRRIGTFRAVVCLVLVVSASSGDGAGPESAKDVFTAIVGTALGGPPSAVHGTDGRHHVVYELVLTNAKAVPATLQAVEVLATRGSIAARFSPSTASCSTPSGSPSTSCGPTPRGGWWWAT